MTTTTPSTAQLLAVRPAALFDGIGARPLLDPVVLIEDGRVIGVETANGVLPEHAAVIDLPGCTLLPGLIDVHVHLCFDAGTDPVGSLANRDDTAALTAMAAAGRQQLQAGVTTVRDLGDRGYLALQLRDRHAAKGPMPTIVASGPPLTTPGGHCHFLGGVTAPGPAGVRAAVAQHAERGVDVIKIMASGGNITPGSSSVRTQYTIDELRAAVDEAHRQGLPITAHAHSTACIAAAVDAGVDGIEHCSFHTDEGVDAPQELIEQIARRRTVAGPTPGLLPGSAPPPAIARRLDDMLEALARVRAAGAPMVAGSDAGVGPPKPHGVLPYVGEHLQRLGFANHEALRLLTTDAARVCGLGHRKGRVAPGFDADLLAVEGDPFTTLDALHDVVAVLVEGKSIPLTSKETQ